LLSFVFLCIPGAGWNAFSATGGGNVGDPNTYAFFNGTFGWFFGGLSLLAPIIVNLAGYRTTLFIGGLGYPITIMLFYLWLWPTAAGWHLQDSAARNDIEHLVN